MRLLVEAALDEIVAAPDSAKPTHPPVNAAAETSQHNVSLDVVTAGAVFRAADMFDANRAVGRMLGGWMKVKAFDVLKNGVLPNLAPGYILENRAKFAGAVEWTANYFGSEHDGFDHDEKLSAITPSNLAPVPAKAAPAVEHEVIDKSVLPPRLRRSLASIGLSPDADLVTLARALVEIRSRVLLAPSSAERARRESESIRIELATEEDQLREASQKRDWTRVAVIADRLDSMQHQADELAQRGRDERALSSLVVAESAITSAMEVLAAGNAPAAGYPREENRIAAGLAKTVEDLSGRSGLEDALQVLTSYADYYTRTARSVGTSGRLNSREGLV